jgi:hypothetical protein
MREVNVRDGRWCVLRGTGIHGAAAGGHDAGAAPTEIVEFLLPDVSGTCVLPGGWATRDADDLVALVEEAARYALGGEVAPFAGRHGRAIRDLAIRAARMPSAQLRALAHASAAHHAERRAVTWRLDADAGLAYEARHLPRYLRAAARVVLVDGARREGRDMDDATADAAAAGVATAIGPAADALLVCDRPRMHDHSVLAGAYRALVAPFQA